MDASDSMPIASDAGVDLRVLDDRQLVTLAIGSNEAALRVLVDRHAAALREAARDTDSALSSADASNLVSDLWSSLLERNMRQLREFEPSRGAVFLSWMTIRLTRLVASRQTGAEVPPTEQPTLMRVEELAKRWDIDRKTVYAMIERGQLVSRRCGRLVRIPRKVIESFELQASVSPERTG